MKVIHLPVNIASQVAVTVEAQRALGIDARGLVRKVSPIQDCTGLESVAWGGKPNPVARLVRSLRWRRRLVRALSWADVVHWYWGESTWKGFDLRIAAWLKKPRLVEFWGDDVRIPDIASRDNPFIGQMYTANPNIAAENHSHANQLLFQQHGFECLIPGWELSDYLDPGIFPEFHRSRVRLALDRLEPCYPDPSKARPLVAHAPSNKLKKGTEAVEVALGNLARTYAFDFKLIHQMPRAEALKVVAECDIFLDQFTMGAEGLAAYEAMALGKPVVCFVKPGLRGRYPADFPILSADQTNLETVLIPLLRDGPQRHQTGRQSRRYVERHHDARTVASDLVRLYEQLRDPAQRARAVARAQSRPVAVAGNSRQG